VSDNDTGPRADAAGHGRARTGRTDNDTGSFADAAGRGRGRSGCSDSDGAGGRNDPPGRGRYCR
jgi:hypothetical protein